MDVSKIKTDFLYYRAVDANGVLDGNPHPAWYHDQQWDIVDIVATLSAFEIIEFITLVFHDKYANHLNLMYALHNHSKEFEERVYQGREFTNESIKEAVWTIFEEKRFSKTWKTEVWFKCHLDIVKITFTDDITGSKDNVVRALKDKKYKLRSDNSSHHFEVKDSPIESIELRGNVFTLKINGALADNYFEAPELLVD